MEKLEIYSNAVEVILVSEEAFHEIFSIIERTLYFICILYNIRKKQFARNFLKMSFYMVSLSVARTAL